MAQSSESQQPLPDVLHQIVDLNIEFRELIAAGNWDAATTLEQQRRAALQTLFEHPIKAADRNRVIETLRELLESDQMLARNLTEVRDHCSAQIGKMQLGKKATSAYQESGLIMQGPGMMQ